MIESYILRGARPVLLRRIVRTGQRLFDNREVIAFFVLFLAYAIT
jgi:hypothetical protein